MKGFKPTGYGPSAGFKYPAHMGFTGSTGAYTNVSPYVRRKGFANGGFVRDDNPLMKEASIGDQGSPLVRRARSSTQADQESGGKGSLRPGYKGGGKAASKDGPRGAYGWDMKKGGRATKKVMKKADGGTVDRSYRVPRRSGAYPLKAGLSAIPALLKEALMSPKLAADPASLKSGRSRQIERYLDEAETGKTTASNYSRGGKMKRMGYADGGATGGARDKYIRGMMPKKKGMTAADLEERSAEVGAMRAGDERAIRNNLYEYKRSGPEMKQMIQQLNDVAFGAPNHTVNFNRTRDFKPVRDPRFAKGGGVSADQAKKIAQRTVGEHVRYPAPKGHKGLDKMIAQRR